MGSVFLKYCRKFSTYSKKELALDFLLLLPSIRICYWKKICIYFGKFYCQSSLSRWERHVSGALLIYVESSLRFSLKSGVSSCQRISATGSLCKLIKHIDWEVLAKVTSLKRLLSRFGNLQLPNVPHTRSYHQLEQFFCSMRVSCRRRKTRDKTVELSSRCNNKEATVKKCLMWALFIIPCFFTKQLVTDKHANQGRKRWDSLVQCPTYHLNELPG